MKRTANPKYDIDAEPIVLSKPLLDTLLKQEHPADLIALYLFYYSTTKWQDTNQPNTTTSNTAKILQWSESRVRRTEQYLQKLRLLENGEEENAE